MICRWPVALLSFFIAAGAWAANPTCQFEWSPAGMQKLGPLVGKDNWLAIENQRLTLQTAEVFMPTWKLVPTNQSPVASTQLPSIDGFPTIDPLDGSRHDLGFLLDSRLYADGILVLRNGRVVAERYRNGLAPDKPRLLLDTTRPLLNVLAAISINQGKLTADKSVTRYLPALTTSSGMRKMSIQRLIENKGRHAWLSDDLDAWRQASGWTTNRNTSNIRSWLSQPEHWNKPLADQDGLLFSTSPDDDLLAWVLTESNAVPLTRLFCEQLLSRINLEHPALWTSDSQGVELASGLGLSLRDFAKLGQLLVDTRSNRGRAKIPAWFIETLVASSSTRSAELNGLTKGSEQRYGFVRLGGTSNRAALIGAHGTSLYIDFDKRLVIALFATRPGGVPPETLALLEQTWKAIDQGIAMRNTTKGGKP